MLSTGAVMVPQVCTLALVSCNVAKYIYARKNQNKKNLTLFNLAHAWTRLPFALIVIYNGSLQLALTEKLLL